MIESEAEKQLSEARQRDAVPRRRRSRAVDLPGLRPVSPMRISDDVCEQIRRLILSEGLDVGARLPSERTLAERFGASRPTVSQAFRQLSLMGMIEIRRGSGAYVLRRPQQMVAASVNLMLDQDRSSIDHLLQLRLWLETMGVEEAARRAEPLSRGEAEELRAALNRLVEASGNAANWIAADTVFHAAALGATGNRYLAAIFESVHTAVLNYEYDEWLKLAIEPEWIVSTDAEQQRALHQPILDAILDRDPAAARRAVLAHHNVMLEHLRTSRRPER